MGTEALRINAAATTLFQQAAAATLFRQASSPIRGTDIANQFLLFGNSVNIRPSAKARGRRARECAC